jgi:hypothetical protein
MFPKITKYLKRPIGWEDLEKSDICNFDNLFNNDRHYFCGRYLHIGKEDGKLFKFCPRCMVKVNNFRKDIT